ncbi:hypothetical protein O9992_10390 [Vibrio lentus]|nr:hypothetical protein [Vibrio lentus]
MTNNISNNTENILDNIKPANKNSRFNVIKIFIVELNNTFGNILSFPKKQAKKNKDTVIELYDSNYPIQDALHENKDIDDTLNPIMFDTESILKYRKVLI